MSVDHYLVGLSTEIWTTKDLRKIPISDMTTSHINNTVSMLNTACRGAGSDSEVDKWTSWLSLFYKELIKRDIGTSNPRGTTDTMKCHCGIEYEARIADLNRGWAYSCSKSCAAIRREFGRPAATKIYQEICL